jgi:hypothetical protein
MFELVHLVTSMEDFGLHSLAGKGAGGPKSKDSTETLVLYCVYNTHFTDISIEDLDFFLYFIQQCFICCPTDSTVSEDAGIEPRTAATLTLTAKRSNHSTIDEREGAGCPKS